MNPLIIGGLSLAGIILGKIFSKVDINTDNNIKTNTKTKTKTNTKNNTNKNLTRKEILKAVNARVDKLERIKKKKEEEVENANSSSVDSPNVSDSVCDVGSGDSTIIVEEKEEKIEKDEIVVDNDTEPV